MDGTTRNGAILVVVADRRRAFAEALGVVIDVEPGFRCAGIARSMREALDLTRAHAPDVLVLGSDLPQNDAAGETERALADHPHTGLVLVSHGNGGPLPDRGWTSRALGPLPVDGPLDSILDAVRSATRRASAVRANVRAIASGPTAMPARSSLTPRELEVLAQMAAGLNATAIARELDITLNTCRGHIKNVLAKLGAHSQLEAVVSATRLGILSLAAP